MSVLYVLEGWNADFVQDMSIISKTEVRNAKKEREYQEAIKHATCRFKLFNLFNLFERKSICKEKEYYDLPHIADVIKNNTKLKAFTVKAFDTAFANMNRKITEIMSRGPAKGRWSAIVYSRIAINVIRTNLIGLGYSCASSLDSGLADIDKFTV